MHYSRDECEAEIAEMKSDKRMLRALIEEIRGMCERDYRPHGHHPTLLSTRIIETLKERGF